ncbi:hypothetical protein C8J57DRAFT_1733706 [Mycena rebaudengoi]|nr:hypothetical protein C8J57DRAFT_1733706 [Mycena rebaudengoi]
MDHYGDYTLFFITVFSSFIADTRSVEEQLKDSKDFCETLLDRITVFEETRHDCDKTIRRLAEQGATLKYDLSVARGERDETISELREIKLQLADLRQMFLRISNSLIARERHRCSGTLEEQLAEHQRYIMSIGGRLRDGAQETVTQHRARMGRDLDSD